MFIWSQVELEGHQALASLLPGGTEQELMPWLQSCFLVRQEIDGHRADNEGRLKDGAARVEGQI